MMTFDDLKFTPRGRHGGVQTKVFFPNGYGASIIQGEHTYGGDEGLYELAVLRGDAGYNYITYTLGSTEDVEGYLTPETVTDLLQRIEALPNVKKEEN
jgi:hypothetical protein